MPLAADIKTLISLGKGPIYKWLFRRNPEKYLRYFYSSQAANYDQFRSRLLHGRESLFQGLSLPPSGVWMDYGCGTGASLEFVGERAHGLSKILLVDCCDSLLEVAEKRSRQLGFRNVEIVRCEPNQVPNRVADTVSLSYALTMIAGWRTLIGELNLKVLKPGGTIAVVDFISASSRLSTTGVEAGSDSFLIRKFWPWWFSLDGVYLTPAHYLELRRLFNERFSHFCNGRVPYLMGMKAPYYQFVGTKD